MALRWQFDIAPMLPNKRNIVSLRTIYYAHDGAYKFNLKRFYNHGRTVRRHPVSGQTR